MYSFTYQTLHKHHGKTMWVIKKLIRYLLTINDFTSNKAAKNKNSIMEDYTVFCKIAGGVRGSCWEAIQVNLREINWTYLAKRWKSISGIDRNMKDRGIKSLGTFAKLSVVWHHKSKKCRQRCCIQNGRSNCSLSDHELFMACLRIMKFLYFRKLKVTQIY